MMTRFRTQLLDQIERALVNSGEFSIARAFPHVSWEWTLSLGSHTIHSGPSPRAVEPWPRGDPLNGVELKQAILNQVARLLGDGEPCLFTRSQTRLRWRWQLATHSVPQDTGSFTVSADGEI